VLVVFSDGEAHDTLSTVLEAAERLRRERVRLILVAEGGVEPVPIPVRNPDGTLVGYQREPMGEVVSTVRRDDILAAVADAAQGVLVSARLGDQAGAVRDLVAAYKRSPQATSTAAEDISRAWVPLLIAALILLAHTFTRRSMALVSLGVLLAGASSLEAQAPRNRADEAWASGDFREAAVQYLAQVRAGEGGDTTWYNLGTAALAAWDTALARDALQRAAASLDPELRFRAVYNLGLLLLHLAERDSAHAAAHIEEAARRYRQALLLKPSDDAAKWNLELAVRMRPPLETGAAPPPGGGEGGEPPPPELPPDGLSPAQAQQILNSMADEERRTRRRHLQRQDRRETRGRKEW
jgi:tetratricopeptide (TPR) repeat protein